LKNAKVGFAALNPAYTVHARRTQAGLKAKPETHLCVPRMSEEVSRWRG